MSLVLMGKCHGYNQTHRTFGSNEFVDNLVLVEVEQINQYGIPEVKTVSVKLSKRQMENGFNNLWDQLKGKLVSIPVFVGPWSSKGGNAGYDLWLAGDGKPLNIQQVPAKPVQAAG